MDLSQLNALADRTRTRLITVAGWARLTVTRRWKGLVALVLAAALAVVGSIGVGFELSKVDVPRLVGLSLSEAFRASNEVDLILEVQSEKGAIPPRLRDQFRVESVEPSAGTRVERDTQIRVTVSARVPNLRGMTPQEAESLLTSVHLVPDWEAPDVPDFVLEHYEVSSQTVVARSYRPLGSDVAFSARPSEVEVPSLSNMTYQSAVDVVEAAGLIASEVALVKPPGLIADAEAIAVFGKNPGDLVVVGQSIAPGAPVVAGTSLSLSVELPSIVVPSVVQLGPSEAVEALESAGLAGALNPTEPPYDAFAVSQSPKAGSIVLPGSTVTVRFAEPQITYRVIGNGTRAMITWIPPGSFNIGQDTNARLPWSMSWRYTGSRSGNFNAQMLNGSSITCQVLINGRVVDEQTSTGAYAIASCG